MSLISLSAIGLERDQAKAGSIADNNFGRLLVAQIPSEALVAYAALLAVFGVAGSSYVVGRWILYGAMVAICPVVVITSYLAKRTYGFVDPIPPTPPATVVANPLDVVSPAADAEVGAVPDPKNRTRRHLPILPAAAAMGAMAIFGLTIPGSALQYATSNVAFGIIAGCLAVGGRVQAGDRRAVPRPSQPGRGGRRPYRRQRYDTTPYLVVDVDVLRRNLAGRPRGRAERGLALRPHAKTHKCLEIAGLQLELGAVGLTVATIGEAEVFAAAGYTDLFLAYPVWAGGGRGRRLRALAEAGSLRVGVDSAESAQVLADAVRGAAGPTVQVVVEIDSGHHRSGVTPDAVAEVAEAAVKGGLDVVGAFTFPGHSYGPGGQRSLAAADEANALEEAATELRRSGIEPTVLSGGSTPSLEFSDDNVMTEVRPGVYAFNDAQQLELGVCDWSDLALSVAATVVSRRPGTIVLDSGGKALAADRKEWNHGFGRLPDFPGAQVVALSEHHATVALEPGTDQPALGDIVRVVPNHVCAAVNLADEYVVVSEGHPIARWPVAARGRNN